MDFMVHQEQLRNNLLLICLFGMFGCNAIVSPQPQSNSIVLLNKREHHFAMQNGLLLLNNKPFSGKLFALFPTTNDTSSIENYLNGKEHGEWLRFYESKKLREKRYFVNGQKTGIYLTWWENGNKQMDYQFVNDEYEGTCREWNEKGMLNKEMNYKKGHEDGRQQWWYDNGKIKANYVIKDGRRYGLLGTKNCINVSDSIFKK